ncbi:MAG: hypothetical protein JSR77_11065 [Planctomycetes bacterium]|nr:hypothetical protein [Planctomycetota bacterium]
MNLEQCKAAAKKYKAGMEDQVPEDLWMSSAELRKVAKSTGVVIPAAWLELLDYLYENMLFRDLGGEEEVVCNLALPDRLLAEWSRPGGPYLPEEVTGGRAKCLEFGSDDFGNIFAFDCEDPAMPADASVLFINHEDSHIARQWNSVIEYVWESIQF